MKLNKLFVVFFIIIYGCGNYDKINTIDDFAEYKIEGEVINDSIIARSPKIFCLDSLLLVSDYASTPILRVYKKNNNKPIVTYGARGRSKSEFISPMVTSILGDTIIINDFSKKTISSLVFDKENEIITELNNLSYSRKSSDNAKYSPSDFMINRLSNGNYVGLSLSNHDKMFSFYDHMLNFKNEFGDFLKIEGASSYSIKNNMQGDLKSFDDIVVYASYRVPYVAVYRYNNSGFRKEWEDEVFPIELNVIDSDIKFNRDSAKGMFSNITISKKYIYLLFDDSYLKDDRNDGSNMILVYDHRGKRCAKLLTEYSLSSISIDKDDTVIYGIESMYNKIIAYNLRNFIFK